MLFLHSTHTHTQWGLALLTCDDCTYLYGYMPVCVFWYMFWTYMQPGLSIPIKSTKLRYLSVLQTVSLDGVRAYIWFLLGQACGKVNLDLCILSHYRLFWRCKEKNRWKKSPFSVLNTCIFHYLSMWSLWLLSYWSKEGQCMLNISYLNMNLSAIIHCRLKVLNVCIYIFSIFHF